MGFWQGLNQGLDVVREDKARKRELDARQQELEDERALRKQERAEDWGQQLEMFSKQQAINRENVLLPAFVQRAADERAAKALAGRGQEVLKRFEGVDDPRVAALAADPIASDAFLTMLDEAEKNRYKEGLNSSPLVGKALLDVSAISVKGGGYEFMDINPEDLSTIASNPELYLQTMVDLSAPLSNVTATLKPEAYFIPDAGRYDEGRALFDQNVVSRAVSWLEENKGSPTEDYTDVMEALKEYGKDNSAGKIKLRSMFGAEAAASIMANPSNPNLQDLTKDLQIAPYVEEAKQIEQENLKSIADNPNAPVDQRQAAREILRSKHGINYQGFNVNGR